jgi:hypothetical protein
MCHYWSKGFGRGLVNDALKAHDNSWFIMLDSAQCLRWLVVITLSDLFLLFHFLIYAVDKINYCDGKETDPETLTHLYALSLVSGILSAYYIYIYIYISSVICDFYVVMFYIYIHTYIVYVCKSMTLMHYSRNMQFNSLEIWHVFLADDGS